MLPLCKCLRERFLPMARQIQFLSSGIKTARKHVTNRRNQVWADKDYKKAHLGTRWKANPFAELRTPRASFSRRSVEAKQPNSAIRKCVRVQLIKNSKKITAFVPKDCCLNFVEENDEVLVAGFGRKGHAVGDIPGVRFKIVKVANVSLNALFLGKKRKAKGLKRISKFIKKNRQIKATIVS